MLVSVCHMLPMVVPFLQSFTQVGEMCIYIQSEECSSWCQMSSLGVQKERAHVRLEWPSEQRWADLRQMERALCRVAEKKEIEALQWFSIY